MSEIPPLCIAITGASGLLGQAIVQELAQLLHPDECLSLRLIDSTLTKSIYLNDDRIQIDLLEGDTSNRNFLLDVLEGANAVIHAETIHHTYHRSLVGAVNARTVMQVSREIGVQAFVLPTRICVGRGSQDLLVDEQFELPANQLSPYEVALKQAETTLLHMLDESMLEWSGVVLRFAPLYGYGDRFLLDPLLNGSQLQVGFGTNRITWMSIHNAAYACQLAAFELLNPQTRLGITGSVFCLSDDEELTHTEWTQHAFAHACGRPHARVFSIPKLICWFLALGYEFLAWLVSWLFIRYEPIWSRTNIHLHCRSVRVVGDKARRVLNYQPRYSVEEAMRLDGQQSRKRFQVMEQEFNWRRQLEREFDERIRRQAMRASGVAESERVSLMDVPNKRE
eukprot:TRINITY_DN1832_c0_g1_i10.p1 TRINITY_DN1832_c0_g1~~TRINITY_DN1832_c0_g1_i10.p1  ORF type:complete len:395 (+),score=62.97 TRINITY_DN1832_c0_g1_i10:79-1263(+)